MATHLQTLIESKLGSPLDDLISQRREDRASWRVIAYELRDRTGIDVSDETLRAWYSADKASA